MQYFLNLVTVDSIYIKQGRSSCIQEQKWLHSEIRTLKWSIYSTQEEKEILSLGKSFSISTIEVKNSHSRRERKM